MPIEVPGGPERERSTVAFLIANPFRLLGVAPTTTDSDIELAYSSAQNSQPMLNEAYEAVKDPVLRLQAELAYPLDCPSDLFDLFYSDAPAASVDDILLVAARFPALTRTNYLARCAPSFAASARFLQAIIDGQAAIDPMDIYQTLQKTRQSAGRPAPSLVSVHEGLDDLLAAQHEILIAQFDTVEAVIAALLHINTAEPFARDRSRAEILSRLLSVLRSPIRQASVQAKDRIEGACNALRHDPDDGHLLEELASGCSATAFLSDAGRQLLSSPLLFVDDSFMWEQLRRLLDFLAQQQRHEPAQRVMDALSEAFRPFATEHAQAVDLARPLQERNPDVIEADEGRDIPSPAGQNADRSRLRYGLLAFMIVLAAAIILGATITYWYVRESSSNAPQLARLEPELLPPASRGQRYQREFVRYCLFQEERLRVVRQHVQSPDDTRAYNALVIDWNSRCADYFYQDEDLRVVKDEVVTRQMLLKADAERILSTWPWRSTASNPAK